MAENTNIDGMNPIETRGKRPAKQGSRHVWNSEQDALLVECLTRLAQSGKWKADNGQFRSGYVLQLEKWMHEKIPGCSIKGSPHIESRVKLWKKQYHAIQEMLGPNGSGFGWNDAAKCITCDATVFNDWVKSHPGAVGLRNKPFPFLEELSHVFGKDRATGEGAETPADAVEEIANEEAATTNDSYIGDDFWDIELEDDINVADGADNPRVIPSPTNAIATSLQGTSQAGPSRKVKRKRSFGQDVGTDEINNNINSIGSWIESFGEHVARLASCFQFLSDDADAKKKVFGELLKLEGLTQSEMIKVGGILVQDTSKVSYFFSLPDDCKEEYVRLILDGCR
ncbi:hypothetical protein J5N97_014691 [Dioscorea zingiberensis]|uniref:Myb/SANT-like domain-containing protein n=1 Tax=Dioscorea zingiberensis TaxID=325984 RepID=A0A9D5HKB1_9LILI|nr:hypothetical protein J5N97_014691 [Dioscorea zingiberensis]